MYDFRAMGFSQSVCAGSNASGDCSRHSALNFRFFPTPTGIFGDYEMINNIEVSVGTGASSDTFPILLLIC